MVCRALRPGERLRLHRDFALIPRTQILLLFDAHKLDISDEFRAVIERMKGHDDKVRCVLNKADAVDRQKLMRVCVGFSILSKGRRPRAIVSQNRSMLALTFVFSRAKVRCAHVVHRQSFAYTRGAACVYRLVLGAAAHV